MGRDPLEGVEWVGSPEGGPIQLLARKVPVSGLQQALAANEQLWNQHTARTAPEDSPHHGLDDIWVRFVPPSAGGYAEQPCKWMPAENLLGVRPLCEALVERIGAIELGGVLITRIPAGKECKPHADFGWHALKYQKLAVQVEAAPGQWFCFEEKSLETQAGDLFWFDNSFTHWVTNPTEQARVTMVVCYRMRGR
jgi:hypothetical protein